MNTNPKAIDSKRSLNSILRRRPVQVLILLLLVVQVWLLYSALWRRPPSIQASGSTFVVKRGPLTIAVTESGTITSRDQAVVKSQVEGQATILWLIPEGTNVKAGDLLVELDASSLEDQKTKQQITVLNAEASFIQARENLAVTVSQTESDIAAAELAYKFAQLDLEKYSNTEGEYAQQLQQLENEITIAQEELDRAIEKLQWSEKLAAEGYITETELKADQLSQKKSQLDLDLARGKLQLLEQFTHQRDLQRLQSDVEQAEKALERVKRKASADVVQAEAQLKAKESEFTRQNALLDKAVEQIAKCKITAPVAGMAVYSTTGKGSFRGNEQPLAEGQAVRERQELIYLPTTSSMMAEVKIHESSLRKIRPGMPAHITCDALPGKLISGRVGKIGLLPDAQSAWMNPDLKVFNTQIYLDGDNSDVRPGMSCRAEIIVEQYPEAVYVPVQSVIRVDGKPTVYVVNAKGSEARQVQLGLDNNQMVRILSGLDAGEQVLLAPPLSASSLSSENQVAPEAVSGDSPSPGSAPQASVAEASVPAVQTPAGLPNVGSTNSAEGQPGQRRRRPDQSGTPPSQTPSAPSGGQTP